MNALSSSGMMEVGRRPQGWFGESSNPIEPAAGLLSRHWFLIALWGILGIAGGAMACLVMQPVFRVHGSIELLDREALYTDTRHPPDALVSPVTAEIQTDIKILQSDTVIERALTRMPEQLPASLPAGNTVQRWLTSLFPGSPGRAGPESIRQSLEIRNEPPARLIEIFYEDGDPVRAARFLNTLCDEFLSHHLTTRSQSDEATRKRLAAQLRNQRARLEESENALRRYARRSSGLILPDRSNSAAQALQHLDDELARTRAERLAKQSRLEMALEAAPGSLPDVLNDPTLTSQKAALAELNRQYAEKRVTFNREYPEMRKLEAQIAAVTAELARGREEILGRIDNEYKDVSRREELLRREIAARIRALEQDSELLVQYEILNRDVESNRQLYDVSLQRAQNAGLASATYESPLRILDPARPAETPISPSQLQNCALGLVIGLLAGVLIAITRERQGRIRKPGDIEASVDVAELGAIPDISFAKPWLPSLRRRSLAPLSLPEDHTTLVASTGKDPRVRVAAPRLNLLAWQYPHSLPAEAFRAALTSVLFSEVDGRPPKVLVVTSAGPGEGKSTVASNLATAAAEMHQRVLLVDADLRRPRLHDWFGVPNQNGLVDYLMDSGVPPAGSLAGLAKPTIIDGLKIIPAGEIPSGYILHAPSPPLLALLAIARREFDIVLIDTPPVLMIPDARLLGRLADGVLLVARTGETMSGAIGMVRERLLRDGIPVVGAVLNRWDVESSPIPYYRSYWRRDQRTLHRIGAMPAG